MPDPVRALRNFPVADFSQLAATPSLWSSTVLADLTPAISNRDSGRAFFDVCAHRRSAILDGGSQHDILLQCPYHGWEFDQDGNCKSESLFPLNSFTVGGLKFVHAGPSQVDEDGLDDVRAVFEQFKWDDMRLGARRTYRLKSNWVYWTENFLECYHCSLNHPQLCSVENHIAASANGDFDALGKFYNQAAADLSKLGSYLPTATDWDPDVEIPAFIDFNTLVKSHGSATQSGAPVGPPINEMDQHHNVFYYGAVGPFFHFSIYSDYMFIANFHPSGPDETVVDCCWLTHKDATADETALVWLWDETMLQDIELVERLHVGRSVDLPGAPAFLENEEQSEAFHDWICHNGFRKVNDQPDV